MAGCSFSHLFLVCVAQVVASIRIPPSWFPQGKAQITIDISFQIHEWSSSEQNSLSPASLEFCLQPVQPQSLSDGNCQHGMYLVEGGDIGNDDNGDVDIPMVFYSPGSLAVSCVN